MARYWISTTNPIHPDFPLDELSKEELEKAKTVANKLDELGFDEQIEGCNLTFKTESLEEARTVADKARTILNEWDNMGDDVSIVTQPECPDCGYLGRFQQSYCPDCETELTQKQYID